jgi:hypothetical protein
VRPRPLRAVARRVIALLLCSRWKHAAAALWWTAAAVSAYNRGQLSPKQRLGAQAQKRQRLAAD